MAKVTFPARCTVAVVCGEHLVSQVYPASVPIEVFLDDVVELLNDELRRRGLSGLESGVGYELQRVNGTRLDVTRTLDDLGVEDGATLVLVPAIAGDSFEPQYESLSTGLARVGKRLFTPVTAQTAAHVALAILALIALTVGALAIRNRLVTDALAATIVTGAFGMLTFGGTGAVARWWPQRTDLLGGFGWLTVPLLAVSAGSAAPGGVGAAHLFIAGLTVAVLTCALTSFTGRNLTAAAVVVTLCTLGGATALTRMWRSVPAQWLGMCALVALLLLLTLAPTIALWASRIRPPHFGSITGRDLFRRSDGLPIDAVAPVDDADDQADDDQSEPNPDNTPRGSEIAAAARRANSVLTGICVGAALALPGAVWATLLPGREKGTAAAVLTGLFVLIFISRARVFADRRQAAALVCGAAGAVCLGVVKYVLTVPAESGEAVLWGALALAVFGFAGLLAALLIPVTRFTPLVRMIAEWLELLAIVAALPLAAWIGGTVHMGPDAMTTAGRARCVGSAMAVLMLIGASAHIIGAQAIPPPRVDPGMVPPDDRPGPERPMRQSNMCAQTVTVADPSVTETAPGFTMLNIRKAWEYSTGNGVPVAVIDTGINPNTRLPVVAGGDYIMGGDGLMDCDAHGTIIASLIGAAPQGTPMPAPMPAGRAFPPPAGPPPATEAPPPPGGPPAPPAPRPPPAPVTITETRTEPPPPPPPPVAPANAPGDPVPGRDDPAVPPPPPGAPDGVAGVAPHATVISIRQSSRAYEFEDPDPGDNEARRKAGTIASLASAIVHAANMGAKVINLSVTSCVSAADPLDQRALGAAVWYAATVKDAVLVAAAGNEGEENCAQNPLFNPLNTEDPRDWGQVKTVSSPSWFSDYVLSVGAVDNAGAPVPASLAGPWVRAAAPGVGIMGLSPQSGGPVNAYPPSRAGEPNTPFWGTSFSAAYVSGVAALVRAKFPELSANQVINRILQTAHNPPRGVDNQVGYGVVDPVAALTFDVPPGPRLAPAALSRVIVPPPPPLPPDHRARTVALSFAGATCGVVLLALLLARARRAR